MPEAHDINNLGSHREELTWLSQYYTSSKTSGGSEAALPADGPAPADLFAATPGEKYDVTGQVGAGGMKLVQRAHDRNADRDVALAMLRKDAPRSSQERRFLREARITAALEHPNIVPVHEIGLDAGKRPYFTMKLLGGENLHDILQHLNAGESSYLKQYPPSRRLEIFQNVCHAMAFAHSRGVVHLDLKPANIQVGSFGEVLVLDWGLAKILDGSTVQLPDLLREVPVEGAVRGTPGYMAPEQERGDFPALDRCTDIFALGAVLKALVTGKWSQHKAPPALMAIVAKAMAPAPRDRYQSVEALARDVRAFLGGYAVSAQNVGFGTLFWLLVKRHKAVFAVIAGSLVTITALLSVFVIKITQSERRAVDALAQTTLSEHRAMDALSRLRDEEVEKLRLGRLATPQLLNHAEELIRTIRYDEALTELNLIVTLDSSLAQAWIRKGFLHLGRQEFAEAVQVFDRLPNYARRPKPDKTLRAGEIADKYLQLNTPPGALAYPQLLQLIQDITSKTNALSTDLQEIALGQLFQNVNHAGPADPAHLEFIHNALSLLNPPATNFIYEYRSDTNDLAVELHGKQVSQIIPLTGLPISILDLSGTAVVELRWLRNSDLQVLNLTDTPVRELSPIFNLPVTELRLVNCVNVRLEQLRNLPKLEKVIVSEKQVPVVERLLSQSRQPPQVVAE